jgi:hypothetical protein
MTPESAGALADKIIIDFDELREADPMVALGLIEAMLTVMAKREWLDILEFLAARSDLRVRKRPLSKAKTLGLDRDRTLLAHLRVLRQIAHEIDTKN